jgi:magnesium-transporting ATPase (P-type)
MVFVGIVGIVDPPRPEAIEAIHACHRAGIRVKMITGDHAGTARAIGAEMGIKGSEATKEAADIVLADDNFTSIERTVEEGRTIYDNLRKTILFILPTNGAEALVILAAVVLGLALPLTPVQILWVNMVTVVTLALALAFEPPEPKVMSRPPRKPGASILGAAFLWRIGFVSVLIGGATIAVFLIQKRLGLEKGIEMHLELARTLAVNTLVCGQAFYLFNSRYLHETSLSLRRLFANRIAWVAVGILALFQLIFVYAPMMQHWFGSVDLELHHWLIPLGIGSAAFLIVEVEKAITQRFLLPPTVQASLDKTASTDREQIVP